MTSPRTARSSAPSAKQLAAVATAAIPVVMLSSLGLAQPAAALEAPAEPETLPALVTLGEAETAAPSAPGVPSAVVAGSVPSSVTVQLDAVHHIVAAGDTVSSIAAAHSLSVADVLAANGLSADSLIYPGEELLLSAAAAPSAAPAAAAAPAGDYVIVAGDTLSGIAGKLGVGLSALTAANALGANDTIYAGKTLRVPGVGAAATTVAPIAAPAPAATAPLPANEVVPSTFLHYTYPDAVVADANGNKAALLNAPSPSRAEMQSLVAQTAAAMGVDPSLALAIAQQESGFNHQSVSPANAIGTMQVIPDAGDWASGLVGRELNLLSPEDNVVAGVAILRALISGASSEDLAIAGYYQGQYSVSVHGMYADTVNYVAGINTKRAAFQ